MPNGCPDHNWGGFRWNEDGMTLNPYFADLKKPNDNWSTLLKSDQNGTYPNRPKDMMGGLLGGSFGNAQQSEPFEDLRNRWVLPPSKSPRTQSFGPSMYQQDYTPFKPEPELGAEQMRLAAFLDQRARNNMYRPHPPRRGWQGADEWVPKRPIACAPCTGVRIPCRHPGSNISTNVPLDHGFGTYRTETQDQFDRPMPNVFERCTYELPSGFSTSTGSRHLTTRVKRCDDDDYRSRRLVVTPPQRYNPWPRFLLGHEVMLRNEYRPQNIDYKEFTVGGTTSNESHPFIS